MTSASRGTPTLDSAVSLVCVQTADGCGGRRQVDVGGADLVVAGLGQRAVAAAARAARRAHLEPLRLRRPHPQRPNHPRRQAEPPRYERGRGPILLTQLAGNFAPFAPCRRGYAPCFDLEHSYPHPPVVNKDLFKIRIKLLLFVKFVLFLFIEFLSRFF